MAGNQAAAHSEGWLRRKRKFDVMSSDLCTVLAGKSGKILCPLCLKEFDESDIKDSLTEEHVIPSSADGRVTTLTCRSCNSISGSEIDSHFARMFRIEEARQTGGTIDAQIKIRSGVGCPAQVSFTENGLHCQLAPTTQYVRKVLMERLTQYEKGERELSFTLYNNIDLSKLVASMVKAAYLGLFVDWGYRYVLLPNTEWVRFGIRHSGPERESFEQLIIPANITDIGELPTTPTRMSFSAVCGGVNVSCSIMNGVLGHGAFWALLPPIFDLNTGRSDGLVRAAQSILGKSLAITFNGDGSAVIRENS